MQKYKICSICNLSKDKIDFYKKGSQCKSCLRAKGKKYFSENKIESSKKSKQYRQENKDKIKNKRKQYYKANREKILIQQEMYRRENKEKISEQSKKYRANNKEIISKKKKEYYETNLEKTKQYQKEYRLKNSDKLNKYSRIYQKEKRANDILFKLRRDFSRSINGALRKQLSFKENKSILNFLPYTIEELKNHLESLFLHPDNLTADGQIWMTWNNWGAYRCKNWNNDNASTWVWHIDHIIPHSTLSYTSMNDENFRKCWSLANLRPLRADINIIDGAARKRHGVLHGQK